MKSITVKPSLAAPPAFKTFAAAISAAKEENRKFQERLGSGLYGRVVTRMSFSEAACAVYLDDQCVLAIALDPNDFAFVCQTNPAPSSLSAESNASEMITLRMNGSEFAWEPNAIIASVVGARLTDTFYNGINIYLYFSNGLQLSYCSFVTIPDHRPFLHWLFSD